MRGCGLIITSLDKLLEVAALTGKKTLAVAAANDTEVIEAVKSAEEKGIIDALLVGPKAEILRISEAANYQVKEEQIIAEEGLIQIAHKTMELVAEGRADFLMKGLIGTAAFLRALLDKQYNLRRDRLLSHVSVLEVGLDRLVLMTDGAMNIAPDLEKKVQIVNNAVEVAHKLGIEMPLLAPIAAVEVVNPNMPATLEAAALTKMADRGQISGVIIDGPLALDNAISEEAARHKGIKSPVAGKADILLMPNIEAGNVFYKALSYLAGVRAASLVVGAKVPVIVTSRADDAYTKLVSIALGKVVA